MKIKEMAALQRPDERALLYGTEVLSEAELIAVVLRTGTAGKSSVEMANEILSIDHGKNGLGNLVCCSYSDLIQIKGLGRVKALQLACIIELSKRISESRTLRTEQLDRPEKAARFFMEATRHLDHEVAYVLLTDTHNRYIRSVLVAKGSMDAAALSPREIIKSALTYNAAGFILVHNHPSGLAEPSREDICFSRSLRDAGNLMNIRMNDSIIIGEGSFMSLRDRGLL